MRDGWQQATLSEVCVVDWGNTSLTKAAYTQGGKFLAVSAAGCDGRIDHTEHLRHTPVLSAIGAQCGKMFFPLEDFTAIKNTITLTPKPGKCVGKFLYYLLTFIELPQRGAGQPFISKGDIQKFSVSLPGVVEQERIVAILDEAFEGIDTAIANAEKNLASARELFSSYVASVFESGGKNWQKSTIGAEVSLLTGFAFRSQAYTNDGSGVRLLRGDNIVQGELRWDDVKRWPSSDRATYSDYELAEDDIVLAMDRTWIKAGIKFARISQADVPALLVQRVARMRCGQTLLNGFLFYLLGSKRFKKYVLDIQTGLGVTHISGKQIQAFRFERPDISTQQRIVDKMDAVRTRCESLVAKYACELKLLSELKRSILQKAFAGELAMRSVEAVQDAAE